jgi:hypothetical protein
MNEISIIYIIVFIVISLANLIVFVRLKDNFRWINLLFAVGCSGIAISRIITG